jgi:hypothetical protein
MGSYLHEEVKVILFIHSKSDESCAWIRIEFASLGTIFDTIYTKTIFFHVNMSFNELGINF